MSTLTTSTVVRQNERVGARVVEGEALVVVLDSQEVHRLNRVGARIWELCDGRTLAAICDTLTAEFRVGNEAALRDVQAFVAELYRVGALELEGV